MALCNFFLLTQFSNKVTALCFANASKQLISGSEDSTIVIWNMKIKRQEVSKRKIYINGNYPFFFW